MTYFDFSRVGEALAADQRTVDYGAAHQVRTALLFGRVHWRREVEAEPL